MVSIDYFYTRRSEDVLDIDDEGTCTIQVFNDDGQHWTLNTTTNVGWTTVTQIGPFTPDGYADKYSFNYNRITIEFESRKIEKIIDKFINDPHKSITQAIEVELDAFIYDLNQLHYFTQDS